MFWERPVGSHVGQKLMGTQNLTTGIWSGGWSCGSASLPCGDWALTDESQDWTELQDIPLVSRWLENCLVRKTHTFGIRSVSKHKNTFNSFSPLGLHPSRRPLLLSISSHFLCSLLYSIIVFVYSLLILLITNNNENRKSPRKLIKIEIEIYLCSFSLSLCFPIPPWPLCSFFWLSCCFLHLRIIYIARTNGSPDIHTIVSSAHKMWPNVPYFPFQSVLKMHQPPSYQGRHLRVVVYLSFLTNIRIQPPSPRGLSTSSFCHSYPQGHFSKSSVQHLWPK